MQIATVTSVLAPLAVLACPVGMGLMMWVMSRGRAKQRPPSEDPGSATQPASLELLREEQRRLSTEIDRLEQSQPTGEVERERG